MNKSHISAYAHLNHESEELESRILMQVYQQKPVRWLRPAQLRPKGFATVVEYALHILDKRSYGSAGLPALF